jgi:hypothetical protein
MLRLPEMRMFPERERAIPVSSADEKYGNPVLFPQTDPKSFTFTHLFS